jgi:pyrroloquinoline-quinone synthase
MNSLRQSLDVSITCWNLLNHPFYRAWSDGTLPVEKLKRYAAEYGNYIATIANSWRTAGEAEIATEEETHFDMWKKFAKSIGTEVRRPSLRETKTLVALSSECGSDGARILGSLYAFEAQQPHTAASKQQGLEKFYPQLCADDSYFRVHMNEHHEPEILLRRMETISPADQPKTADACEKTARALWDTLTAIDRAHDV